MRSFLTILGLALCHIAVAQVPDAEGTRATQGEASIAEEALPTAVPLTANTLYMCEFKSNSQLFKLNPLNATPTVVGSMGTNERCTDLAFRRTSSSATQLFGTSSTRAFRVDPTTGRATLLSNTYGSGINDINALVAQPGSGKLYGAGSRPPGQFVEINPTTGKATKRGYYGNGLGSAGDLAFLNGQLYGLLTRSGSGTQTFLARISLSSGTLGRATNLLPIQRRINGRLVKLSNVWGLAARNGVLHAVMQSGELLTISASTGLATLKGDNNKRQAGLTISP